MAKLKFLLGISYRNLCAQEIEVRGGFPLMSAVSDVIVYLKYKNKDIKFWKQVYWELNELRKDDDEGTDYQIYFLDIKNDFNKVFEMFFNEFPTLFPYYDVVKFGHEKDYIQLKLSDYCNNMLDSRFDTQELKLSRDIVNLKKSRAMYIKQGIIWNMH